MTGRSLSSPISTTLSAPSSGNAIVRFGPTAAVWISESPNVRFLVRPAQERTGSYRPKIFDLGGRSLDHRHRSEADVRPRVVIGGDGWIDYRK
jgi:hypothetical protein